MDKKYSFCGKQSILALAVASSLTFTPLLAEAAGLGKITVFSGLGQPLRAEVQVSATADEVMGMSAKLAPIDYFRQSGVEFAPALLNLHFSTEKRPGGAVIKISSDKPINDPFLDFLVELSWSSGRLVREYTFLLDPVDIMPQNTRKAVVEAREVPALRSLEAEVKPPPQTAQQTPAPQAAPTATEPAPSKKPDTRETKAAKTPQPAPAPATSAKTETAGEHAEHLVKPGDTLHRIASSNLPEGVSLEQMLVSLYRNNTDAFSNNNMNRLRAGAVLRIPTQTEASEISQQEARKIFHAQSNDWRTYRNNLATAAQAVPANVDSNEGRVASGSVSTTVDEKTPKPAPRQDRVKVSQTAESKGSPGISEEDLIAKQQALEEERARVKELEAIVAKQKSLLKLQDEKLANLQARADTPVKPPIPEVKPQPATPIAENTTTPVTPPPVSSEAPAAATPEAVPPVTENTENQPPVSAEEVPATENEEGTPAATEEPPVQEEAPKPPPPMPAPPPVVEPEPIPEPSFLESIGLLPIVGGLTAIAGGIGLLVYRRRRKAGEENLDSVAPDLTASVPSSTLGPNSVFQTAGGQSVDTNNVAVPPATEFSITGSGAIDTHEVDPVSEADVYMAYGRDTQAEEILLDALQKDPQRVAIHSKLLEIYAMRKSIKQFETLASELYSLTSGQGPDWEKVVSMGKELDPTNPMYGAKLGTAPAAPPPISSLEDDFAFISTPADTGKPATSPGALQPESELTGFNITPGVEASPQPMEFSYEAPDTNKTSPEKNDLSATVVNSASDLETLDFDLGTSSRINDKSSISENLMVSTGLNLDDLPESSLQATTLVSPSESLFDNKPPSSLTLTTSDLSFPAIMESNPEARSAHLDPDEDMEFDMSLTASTVLGNAMPSDFDLSSIDLDLGAEPSGQMTAAGSDPGIQSDDVNTKLDLAKAYEDMGDAEGAIELLKEVVNEGTPEQIEVARSNLNRLGA